ncbi:MAG: GDP-mannose 4,6-dehydratase [Candidatus Sumerlaeia bacterium]|nr:GDP-mannose 4,6-dehydratase [Candidatus Sumerlaeia bacterium]
MKILVTGTAGFIGFHLASALLDEGHEVVGLDNFNAYYAPVLKRSRHALLEGRAGFRPVELSLEDADGVLALMKAEKFDTVVNLAAQAGVRHSLTHPFDYVRCNLDGFLSILEGCRHAGVPRLVYASSSSVYGNNTKLPFSETDNVDHPISLYAASKKANELMAHTYTHLYGFQTIGLRFFTVYGPWGRPDMAMWLFADAILQGRPIKVFNHGDMHRDFTYVAEIVDGVKRCIFTGGLDPCEVFNLGNHRSEKLMDMIATLGRCMGRQPEMELLPMQPGDVPATYADIERARTKLGFEPRTTIEEGVARFIEWFLAHQDLVEQVRRHGQS